MSGADPRPRRPDPVGRGWGRDRSSRSGTTSRTSSAWPEMPSRRWACRPGTWTRGTRPT